MSYITAIGTANPVNRFEQHVIAEFMVRSMNMNDNGESRKLRAIFRASGIQFRHSVLDDFGKLGGNGVFSAGSVPSTEARMLMFQRHACALSVEAAERVLSAAGINPVDITHLVVVSCTGMYAPGLDIDLVKALGLRKTVHRTAINFMGCYAAFNGLKMADAVCTSQPDARVLLVCTELCSLHFQKKFSEDNMLANALFGDGAAAAVVESRPSQRFNLSLKAFHTDLSTDGEGDMAWTVGDLGFEMKLSSYVPELIGRQIKALTDSLLKKFSGTISDVQHFALHPGGKRILGAIEQALGITPYQNRHAYAVLQRYGNMSSATVLFVLREVLNELAPSNNGEHILSFAFGPGLTLESMVLQIEKV